MQRLNVPELEDWLFGSEAPLYPYKKTFSQARYEPFVVLHTSGSTGVPKVVVQTHGTVATVDAWQLIPSQGESPTIIDSFRGIRKFTPFPAFHAAGLGMMLPLAVFCNMVPVLPPTKTPLTAEIANLCHIFGNVQGTILPASVLTEMVREPEYLENLRSLKFVAFGGAPLPKEIGDIVKTVSWPVNWLGATEMVFTPLEKMEADDWEYMKFSPYMGAEFRHHSEDMYELVIVRQRKLDLYQGIFCTYPELDEYPMKDLYSKHPSKSDLWRYHGRADDVIVFSNGEKMNPLTMEGFLESNPNVKSALVLGSGRFRAALLVELAVAVHAEEEKNTVLRSIWKTVEQANQKAVAHGRVSRDLVLLASPAKPFLRAGKGTVQRRLTLQAYQDEINKMYVTFDSESFAPMVNGTHKVGFQPLTNGHTSFKHEYDMQTIQSNLQGMILRSGGSSISCKDDFFEHGMDSLQVVNLVRQINTTLGRGTIDSKTVYQNPNIEQLARVLQKSTQSRVNGHCNGNSDSMKHTEKMQKIFQSLTTDLPISSRQPMPAPKELHILLTGSTGSLGSYLLRELLYNPKVVKVYCLNRGADAAQKQEKSFAEKWLPKAGLSTRTEFMQCNLSRPYLGLAPFDYHKLLENVTHVVHNAWQVDFNLTLDSFVNTHMRGVQQLVDFSARSRNGAFIFFISSIGTVANWDGGSRGPVTEEIHKDWELPQAIGYAQSKAISEAVLEEASRVAGVPSAVCRVGQIAGPTSSDGMWSKQEWLPTLIASSKHLKQIPSSLGPMNTIDWIPVDLLGQIVVELLSRSQPGQVATTGGCDHEYEAPSEATGWSKGLMGHTCKRPAGTRVFHVTNPETTSWKVLLPAVLHSLGSDVKVVPLDEWIYALKSSASSEQAPFNPGLKLLDFFEELEYSSNMPTLQTSLTLQHSETLANMKAVSGQLMRTWMKQWNF